MKLILFDIDGTLLRCGSSPRIAFDRAFSELFSVELAWGNTNAHGRSDWDIIQQVAQEHMGAEFSSDQFEQLARLYVEYLEEEIQNDHDYCVLPGVLELLQVLHKEQAAVLALQTGNLQRAAYVKLQRGGMHDFFPTGGFGSDHRIRTELVRKAIERAAIHMDRRLPPRDVIVIGDSPYDVEAGKALGARTIAVATGRSDTEELSACQPDSLLEDFSQVEEVARLLLENE